MKQLYIQGIFNEVAGLRDQTVADINTYLDNPVGIGEHGNISGEIKQLLDKLDKYDSLIAVMQKYFVSQNESGAAAPADSSASEDKDSTPARVLDEGESK
jgi:hypothetical protein